MGVAAKKKLPSANQITESVSKLLNYVQSGHISLKCEKECEKKKCRQPGLSRRSQKTCWITKWWFTETCSAFESFDIDTLPKPGTGNKVSVNDEYSDFIRMYVQLWKWTEYWLMFPVSEKSRKSLHGMEQKLMEMKQRGWTLTLYLRLIVFHSSRQINPQTKLRRIFATRRQNRSACCCNKPQGRVPGFGAKHSGQTA